MSSATGAAAASSIFWWRSGVPREQQSLIPKAGGTPSGRDVVTYTSTKGTLNQGLSTTKSGNSFGLSCRVVVAVACVIVLGIVATLIGNAMAPEENSRVVKPIGFAVTGVSAVLTGFISFLVSGKDKDGGDSVLGWGIGARNSV